MLLSTFIAKCLTMGKGEVRRFRVYVTKVELSTLVELAPTLVP
jgi:hypothetical protein